MIKEKIDYIMDNYVQSKKEDFKQHPIAKVIRKDIVLDFTDRLQDDYLVKGSSGQGGWANIPWVAFFNKKITDTAQKGYYIVYLFKNDMSGVYLSLNFGATYFNKKYGRKRLKEAADIFRSILLKKYPDLNIEDIKLALPVEKNDNIEDYENGNICSIYYPKENVPSDDKLIEDLEFFFKLYDYLYEQKGTEIFENEEEHPETPISNYFPNWLENKGYYFDKNIIENYLLSLKVKPFVILTGNSGTGKTKLAQLFAQYLAEKIDYPDKNYEVVAVGANWTDNRNIIGYYNTLLKKPEKTETYNLIQKASNDLDNPYFLILDEMNLSYVERYFADFLSAIESGEPMVLPGCSEDDETKNIHKHIQLPPNLFVIGTVNVDETTYMFSPKVLDRANVLEFKTISVEKYMDMEFNSIFDERYNMDFLEEPLNHISFTKDETDDKEKLDINYLRERYSKQNNTNDLWKKLSNDLNELHTILTKSGFDFGFRVTNEILSFILEASNYEKDFESFNWERYLDAQILQKILPKLHGSKNIIEDTLNDLFEFCIVEDYLKENLNKDIKYENLTEENTKYLFSAIKLCEMLDELDKSRYVSFIS